ncbi:WD40-repeat-containing domain protein [Naematelia encephala]|uniref:WD40-repeat-containing domain protein n=1 Tax=Naematelia encephala TaxID=71784 RepID=A0A1Y2AZN9_9TREE|nr:WD40-repeat-containing domain protein [Naematelia encephala]
MMSTFGRTNVKPDVELVQPPSDSVSTILFSPTQDILATGDWASEVRLYDVNSQGQSQPRAMYKHNAPVLALAWSKSGTVLFSASCDKTVQMFDINNAAQGSSQVAEHAAPISCCLTITAGNGLEYLVTAGWDKKLKYWDLSTRTLWGEVDLGERAYTMDATDKFLVVGTADRKIHLIELTSPNIIRKTIDSPLKWQTRVIRCFPTQDAYAIGSIEGRVAIQYPYMESKNYSFKCHRLDIPTGTMPGTPATASSQHVFAVNTIAFHKTLGTFCTGGTDGTITFWDGVARTKLKAYSAKELNNGNHEARPPEFGIPIVSATFNHNQEIMA